MCVQTSFALCLVSFGAGHSCYLLSFWRGRSRVVWWALVPVAGLGLWAQWAAAAGLAAEPLPVLLLLRAYSALLATVTWLALSHALTAPHCSFSSPLPLLSTARRRSLSRGGGRSVDAGGGVRPLQRLRPRHPPHQLLHPPPRLPLRRGGRTPHSSLFLFTSPIRQVSCVHFRCLSSGRITRQCFSSTQPPVSPPLHSTDPGLMNRRLPLVCSGGSLVTFMQSPLCTTPPVVSLDLGALAVLRVYLSPEIFPMNR